MERKDDEKDSVPNFEKMVAAVATAVALIEG